MISTFNNALLFNMLLSVTSPEAFNYNHNQKLLLDHRSKTNNTNYRINSKDTCGTNGAGEKP